jgi:hypothetical protein|tara:strand:- start:448 stop:876 length:429 start_codon:yes stop_codon:yes gene_type:complete
VTFSSISATGKGDLVLVTDTITVSGAAAYLTRFNSDTGVNYSTAGFYGSGVAVSNNTDADYFDLQGFSIASTSRSLVVMNIQDFWATNKHKSVLTRANRTDSSVYVGAGRWANTNAITTIDVSASSNFAAGSTFHLYQIVSE